MLEAPSLSAGSQSSEGVDDSWSLRTPIDEQGPIILSKSALNAFGATSACRASAVSHLLRDSVASDFSSRP
jgi:hypothetical protein